MSRIIYFLYAGGEHPRGGHKMIVRHVEALRELGFDAICQIAHGTQPPRYFEPRITLHAAGGYRDDDIWVLPDDAADALPRVAASRYRMVVFAQGLPALGAITFQALAGTEPADFIAVAPHHAALIQRAYPQARVETVPCFADERLFRPAAAKQPAITLMPSKRVEEVAAIQGFFSHLHARHLGIPWLTITKASEGLVAKTLGEASLFLSLSRLETVGLTPLEAMASGCVTAGYLGIGGEAYATPDNGFWAQDDDCVAAADRLAEAADVAATGGPELKRRLDAGFATASDWSYAKFKTALEETWTRLAPDARLSNGPLP